MLGQVILPAVFDLAQSAFLPPSDVLRPVLGLAWGLARLGGFVVHRGLLVFAETLAYRPGGVRWGCLDAYFSQVSFSAVKIYIFSLFSVFGVFRGQKVL
jgi:hypothetical protein